MNSTMPFLKEKNSCIYHYLMNCCFCFIIQHIGSNANFLRLPVGINNLILYRTWEKEGAGEYATTVLQKKHIFSTVFNEMLCLVK